MAFPSVISSFTNPLATNRLNSPSHSAIETAQNNELIQIETVIGVDGASSVLGTIIGDLRSPGSNGGGHIQPANKGGTGQTAYTKGDLLVASSSSVISKLSVGADGLVPTADSTASAGISYQAVANATTIQNQFNTYARASVVSASVYGVILNTPVSILSDGLGIVVKFPTTNTTSILALSFPYGQSSVTARIKNIDGTNPIVGGILANQISALDFDSVSSVFQIQNQYQPAYDLTNTTQFLRKDATFATIPTQIAYKVGATTYDLSTSSGNQTIAHGLGTTPRKVRITGNTVNGSINSDWSEGSYDGTTMANVRLFTNSAGGTNGSQSTSYIIKLGQDAATNIQTATITVDTTNITLAWTKSGTPNSTGNIMWEVEG